jgi:hypothetical protein
MSVLGRINEYLPLKPTLVGDPDVYLGTKLRNVRLKNGVGLKPIQVRFASRCQLCQTPEQEL